VIRAPEGLAESEGEFGTPSRRWRAHGFDRAARLTHHGFRDAPKHQAIDAAAAVRSENDQVGLPVRCAIQNERGSLADEHARGRFEPVTSEVVSGSADQSLTFRDQAIPHIKDCLSCQRTLRKPERRRQQHWPLYDVKHVHLIGCRRVQRRRLNGGG
jgi:hypothetical protein